MSTITTRPRAFYPALDGLRAVAFLAVFSSHYAPFVSNALILRSGWIGVDVFFVLSGFLITGILYDSLDEPRFFRSFYTRRALRIFPLFYAFWLLMALLTPVLGIVWSRYNLAQAAYFGNFFNAGAILQRHPGPGLLTFTRLANPAQLDLIPLWSLCVEEQFYLVWPLVVKLIRSRQRLLSLCISVVLIAPLLRELYWHLSPATAQHGATYFNTLTRIDTLLVGAAIALWLRGGKPAPQRIAYTLLLAPLPCLALLLALFSPSRFADPRVNWINDRSVNTFGLTLIALSSAGLLLLALQPDTWLYNLLRVKPLLAIGRRSYGLYFVHTIPLFLLADHLLPRLRAHHAAWLFIPIALLYTFSVGWLSFRYLESPFLRLKDRLAPKPNAISDPQPI